MAEFKWCNSLAVFWPLPLNKLLLMRSLAHSFHIFMSHLCTGRPSWFPWIFLFVFVFSLLSPCVAEWPEIPDALFEFQVDWSYRDSSLWHAHFQGSNDKDSALILDSGSCSLPLLLIHVFISNILPTIFFFDLFFIARGWVLFIYFICF